MLLYEAQGANRFRSTLTTEQKEIASQSSHAASLAIVDWDCPWRANRGTGWKEHRHRYQWEHNVIEREKHEKNRLRKENR